MEVSIRPATESDLPALLSLLLTSFRQFPLFAFLYAPLDTDLSAAVDTIFFWRRRLLLELLDPSAGVVIAELPESAAAAAAAAAKVQKPGERGGGGGGVGGEGEEEEAVDVGLESWRMLDWIVARGDLSQESPTTPGCTVVGFAIWNVRVGHAAGADEQERLAAPALGFWTTLRVKALNLEGYLWSKCYQRRDQDLERYKAYLAAEEELSELFYAKSCYYLDNLCVDFRYQRQGIGGKLLEWGIKKAKGLNLNVQTEAGPMGLGLYRKMGFEQVGVWRVMMVGVKELDEAEEREGTMLLPVMRLDLS